jgi:hypothetical protein
LDATSLTLPLEFRSEIKTGEITRKLDPRHLRGAVEEDEEKEMEKNMGKAI